MIKSNLKQAMLNFAIVWFYKVDRMRINYNSPLPICKILGNYASEYYLIKYHIN